MCPSEAQHSGDTPLAKRPLNRDTIHVATHGTRDMTLEVPDAALIQLNARVENEAGRAASYHQCVDHNAQLLIQACESLLKLDASSTAADSVQAAFVLNLTKKIREAFEHVPPQHAKHHATLMPSWRPRRRGSLRV